MALLQPVPTGSPLAPAEAPADVVAQLDDELRAAVRREAIDPQREVPAVRRIAAQLVRDHDERSLTGVVAPVGDPDGVVAELVARVAGFGALQPLLDDPSVEEVSTKPRGSGRRPSSLVRVRLGDHGQRALWTSDRAVS